MSGGAQGDWAQFAAVAAGTLVSEDGTCIAAGLLIRAGRLGALFGIASCAAGIFLGDLGLWLIGRVFGRRLLAWSWVRKRLPRDRVEDLGREFDQWGWKAVVASRFLPGTRVPMYVAAGMVGTRVDRFIAWTLAAVLVWTPLIVGLAALSGERVLATLRGFLGGGWIAFAGALVLCWILLRTVTLGLTVQGRATLMARLSRLWRWEFWPAWVFYLPLVPWIAWLAFRYRGLTTPTAANPGIPHGGVVGESKFDILSKLPPDWVVPGARIAPAEPDAVEPATARRPRVRALLAIMQDRGWTFPLILKPDAGQRGAGVRLIRNADAAARYLDAHPRAVLAQVYHCGPFEAGIFYVRMPDEPRGRIFSITDKVFPVLTGDGASSVETLIRRHPRFRMQARTFLERLNGQTDRVLPLGETLRLALAGNHCQGTMFRDGAHLRTSGLEETIDRIARQVEGFCFGRFDVRYADVDEFKAGRGFSIVELNGATSESTNLYDPSWSLLRAYRTLMRQWALLFEIGDRNRRLGHAASSLREVLADARTYYAARSRASLAD
ncbi:MAG: hypothetical protein FLDDKLPJ_01757 [Phycisphaerae bacterium]|nr:hypothetical protein [Phycisphaerae bacterium]